MNAAAALHDDTATQKERKKKERKKERKKEQNGTEREEERKESKKEKQERGETETSGVHRIAGTNQHAH